MGQRLWDWLGRYPVFVLTIVIEVAWGLLLMHWYWTHNPAMPKDKMQPGRYLLVVYRGQPYKIPYTHLEIVRAQVEAQRRLLREEPGVAFEDEETRQRIFQGTLDEFLSVVIDTLRYGKMERKPIDLSILKPLEPEEGDGP